MLINSAVNRDEFDDVIVGAHLNDAGLTNGGITNIYFGGANMNNTADVILTGAGSNHPYQVKRR